MWMGLLSSVVAAIVNALLGRFFPEHPKITPEAIAQAQRDRGDVLKSQDTARKEADALREEVRKDLTGEPAPGRDPFADPPSVYRPDANQRPE